MVYMVSEVFGRTFMSSHGVAKQWMSSLDLERPVEPAKLWKTSRAGKTGGSGNNELSLNLN